VFILHTSLLASGKYFPRLQLQNNAFDNLKSSHIKHLPTKSSLEAAECGVLVPGSIFNESLH